MFIRGFSGDRRRLIEYGMMVLLLLAILAVTVPTVIGTGYTYLCEDDFSFEGGANDKANELGAFQGALIRTAEMYNGHQGTWLFLFVIHYLRAYTRWGLTGFHAVMILNALFFIGSLTFLAHVLVRNRMATLFAVLCCMICAFSLSGTYTNMELFFWYTGALNYTLELSLTFLAIGMCLLFLRTENRWKKVVYAALSTVSAILASGGSLNVDAFLCAALLLIVVLKSGSIRERAVCAIPFFGALAGSVVNAIAPGNFVRGDAMIVEGHSTVFDALRDMMTCYRNEFGTTLANPCFLLLMALVFSSCLYDHVCVRERGMSLKWLAVIALSVLVIQHLTIFPVVYGYHSESLISLRTTGSYRLMARLLALFVMVCFAQCVGERIHTEKTRRIIVAASAACFLVYACFSGQLVANIKDGHAARIMRDFKSHRMVEAYASRSYVINALEAAPEGTDFVITVPMVSSTESMYGMGFTETEWFVNRSAAGLFRLNSVTVLYDFYDM